MLVEDTTRTNRAMISKVARGIPEKVITKTFTSLMLKGKIRTTMRFVTLRGTGGVLLPDEIDLKSGQPVIDVLRQKHLALIVPNVKVLDHYNVVPESVPFDFNKYTIELISGKLTNAVSLGGIGAAGL